MKTQLSKPARNRASCTEKKPSSTAPNSASIEAVYFESKPANYPWHTAPRAQVHSDSSLIEFVDLVPAEPGAFDLATLRAREFHKWTIEK